MLIGGVALSVLLAIVLVIVVSAMRVKMYKDRFWNIQADHQAKTDRISALENELQEYKIKNAKNQQELAQFDETRTTLKTANESYVLLQDNYNESQKELSQTKATLEAIEGVLQKLQEEHQNLKERFDETQEETLKLRTNNARLLTKLESEERYAQNMKHKRDETDHDND